MATPLYSSAKRLQKAARVNKWIIHYTYCINKRLITIIVIVHFCFKRILFLETTSSTQLSFYIMLRAYTLFFINVQTQLPNGDSFLIKYLKYNFLRLLGTQFSLQTVCSLQFLEVLYLNTENIWFSIRFLKLKMKYQTSKKNYSHIKVIFFFIKVLISNFKDKTQTPNIFIAILWNWKLKNDKHTRTTAKR